MVLYFIQICGHCQTPPEKPLKCMKKVNGDHSISLNKIANQMVSMIRGSVNTAQESGVANRNAWTRCMHAAQCAINAFSPFAKRFLVIAKEGQDVFTTYSSLINICP